MNTGKEGSCMSRKFLGSGIIFALWIVFIILLKTFDVAPIGPEDTSVGFATVNGAIHNMLGFNNTWYTISKLFGYVSILGAVLMALYGVYMIVRKRHIMKVDHALLATYVLYFAVIVIYILFEVVIINYRPVIMPGEEHVEASFPSSHTMLGMVFNGSFFLLIQRYVKDRKMCRILSIVTGVLLVASVLSRLFSGVHWFTDILGGVWISTVLLLAYDGALDEVDKRRRRKKRKKKKEAASAPEQNNG